jgi:hypothetical protein
VVGQEQQPDQDLAHDQCLGQRERMGDDLAPASPPPTGHEGKQRCQDADGQHKECEQVMHR